MGTDVHAVWQAKKDGVWQDIASTWEQNRHYFLFAWLANVRNGHGFAGVPTHAPIQPISMPRGLPDDFVHDDDFIHPTTIDCIDPSRRVWMDEEEKQNPSVCIGDHSFSWLTADEILSAPSPCKVWKCGVVPIEFFRAWDGVTPPDEYSGDIAGRDIRRAATPVEVGEDTTHVRIFWKSADDALDYFVHEVRRLKELHGEVRLVFGFDS